MPQSGVPADELVQELDDVRLTGGRGVERPTDLREASCGAFGQNIEALSEVCEVAAHRREDAVVLVTEVADFCADLGDVPVDATGEDPGGRSVLLRSPDALAQVVHVGLDAGAPGRVHS